VSTITYPNGTVRQEHIPAPLGLEAWWPGPTDWCRSDDHPTMVVEITAMGDEPERGLDAQRRLSRPKRRGVGKLKGQ
jgi:hypothetical protein